MKSNWIVAAILVAGAAVAAGSVMAQSDPIAQRKALMKGLGDAGRAPAAMLKGEPFALAPVQAALKAMQDAGKQAPALFPDTSKTGDTAALPKVWETQNDFNAKFAKLEKEAAAAMTTIKDEATFKATYPELLRNCGGCHSDYRARR